MDARAVLTTHLGEVLLAGTRRPFRFASPFASGEFALMVVVATDDVSPEEQMALSRAFIDEGCRYAVCTGHECTTWDDSIDLACILKDPDFDPPDEEHVMTTWHDDEPLEEVARFFLNCTTFDDWVPRRFLALVVGGDQADEAAVEAALHEASRPMTPVRPSDGASSGGAVCVALAVVAAAGGLASGFIAATSTALSSDTAAVIRFWCYFVALILSVTYLNAARSQRPRRGEQVPIIIKAPRKPAAASRYAGHVISWIVIALGISEILLLLARWWLTAA